MQKKLFSAVIMTVFTVALGMLAMVGVASAATTIGTNIYTTGTAGIGTSTPYGLLSVSATAGNTAFAVGSSTATLLEITSNGTLNGNSGGWALSDFVWQGDSQTGLFTIDASADRVGIATSTPYGVLSINALAGQTAFAIGSSTATLLEITSNGTLNGNSGGWALSDFVWQGDGQANLFTVDASADRVGIATSTPYGVLSINALAGQTAFAIGSSTATLLEITSNGTLNGNSGGWALADFVWQGDTISSLFTIDASADKVGIGTSTPWGTFSVNSVAGQSAFAVGSSTATLLEINSNGVTEGNKGGWALADFIWQGDTYTSLFTVDASADRVGVGTSTPSAIFAVGVNNGAATATSTIDLGKPCFRMKTEAGTTLYYWPSLVTGNTSGWATSTTSCF